jgi:hypothetical protein
VRAAARAGRDLAVVGGRCVVVEGLAALREAILAQLDLRLRGYAFEPRAGLDPSSLSRSLSECEAEVERAILAVRGVRRCRARARQVPTEAEARALGAEFLDRWRRAGGRVVHVRWWAEGREPGRAEGELAAGGAAPG